MTARVTTPVTPLPGWWIRLFATWVAVIYGLVGLACFTEPPGWFSAPSLVQVSTLLPVPWPVYGFEFSFVAAGVVFRPTRLVAYFVGFLLAGWFAALQLYFTVFGGEIINAPGTGLILLAPLVSLAGVRYAQAERDR